MLARRKLAKAISTGTRFLAKALGMTAEESRPLMRGQDALLPDE